MATRTFIFCDICNPDGIRIVNPRFTQENIHQETTHDGKKYTSANYDSAYENRSLQDRREYDGRRITDGRSWYEGSLTDAIAQGWRTLGSDTIICPKCEKRK